mmetsp:Transcript_21861/g.62203  ORF Transcript_21861/g.62203 Transcript_21861/m.62203 type:complete len:233 (-) Transcript_21861:3359-4057(-)
MPGRSSLSSSYRAASAWYVSGRSRRRGLRPALRWRYSSCILLTWVRILLYSVTIARCAAAASAARCSSPARAAASSATRCASAAASAVAASSSSARRSSASCRACSSSSSASRRSLARFNASSTRRRSSCASAERRGSTMGCCGTAREGWLSAGRFLFGPGSSLSLSSAIIRLTRFCDSFRFPLPLRASTCARPCSLRTLDARCLPIVASSLNGFSRFLATTECGSGTVTGS